MLRWINNDTWEYISNNQMYYIVTGDIYGYVVAMTEAMKELFRAKTVTEAVRKIEEEEI